MHQSWLSLFSPNANVRSSASFGLLTLVLAYVISVYSTLARRNQFANEIEYRTGRTSDSFGYLRAYLTESDPSLVNQDLTAVSY